MLVGINAQKALERETGVGVYAANLVQALARRPAARDSLCLFLLHGRQELRPRAGDLPIDSREWRAAGAAPRIVWEQLGLPMAASRRGVDLLHYVDHALPLLRRPCPVVVTVHDLAFYRLPQMYETGRRLYKQFVGLRSLRRAAHVIAISETTKNDVISIGRVDENKITVVKYGNDALLFSKDGSADDGRFAPAAKPYFLFVGDLQPRKNVHGLISAFAEAVRDAALPHDLALVGPLSAASARLAKRAGALRVGDRVRFLGPIPHDDLAPVYRRATALVYPSWYEGFGLPPIEAMSCGVPVIVSDRASLPEVVGDAGLVVSPDDAFGLASAMRRVATDRQLAAELARRGLERAAAFSWDRCAEQTMEVYRRIYREIRHHVAG